MIAIPSQRRLQEASRPVDDRTPSACRALRQALSWLVIAALLYQCCESWSFDNVTSALVITASALLTFFYALRPVIWTSTPLPALMILGFNLTTQSGAIIALSLSLRPVVYNLHSPILCFATYFGAQLSLIAANEMWRQLALPRAISRKVATHVLRPLGFFSPPSDFQLWIMGLFGCFAIWLTSVALKDSIQYGDAGGKFLQAFSPLSFAPVLIPAKTYFFPGDRAKLGKARWVSISIYMLVLLVLASVRNSRGTFFVGAFTCGLMFLMAVLMQRIKMGRRTARWIAIGTIGGIASFGALSDLAIAMVIARGHISSASGSEMAALTWQNFKDRDAIDRYRLMMSLNTNDGSYTEPYVENPVIERFVLTKFHDSAITFASDLTAAQTDSLWSVTFKKTLETLPTPLLKLLNLGIDKKELAFSIGDYLYFLHSGMGLGGYRVGSAVAHGWALMGVGLFPFLALVLLVIFTAYNSLTITRSGVCVAISPVALLMLNTIFFAGFLGESLVGPIVLLVRQIPEALLAYCILFQLTRTLRIKR